MIIEICCDGIKAAKKAAVAGAKRIELCAGLSVDGITPPYSEIEEALGLGVAVNVLVRPRDGNFVYSGEEADKMLREIAFCGGIGVNGVVLGALTPEGKIDLPLCRELISVARSYGLEITFHRAIDEALTKALSLVPCSKIPQSPEELSPAVLEAIKGVMEDVFDLGVERILSSGGAPTAYKGRVVLGAMGRFAEESRGPIIMAGGGVTPQNAPLILDATGLCELHGSRLSLLSLQ